MSEKVDIYTCSRCGEMVVTGIDKEPMFCTLCGGLHFEWSHETVLLSLEEYKSSTNG